MLSQTLLASTASILLAGGSLPTPVLSARPELSVVSLPTEAPAASSFYVPIRIENRGTEPLHTCDTAETAPPPNRPCFAVAYRRDKRPPRLAFSRVEVAPVLARSLSVPPGESMERLVRIPTASRGSEQSVFLYLVTGAAGRFDWKEVPLQIKLDPPPPQVRRAIWTAWSLLALYVTLTALGIRWALGRPRRRRT